MDQHTLEWPQQGNARVPYRVFADPEIYRAELDRIFLGPSWQYLGLADELPEPGDYKTSFSARRRSSSRAARTARSMRWSTAAPIAAISSA